MGSPKGERRLLANEESVDVALSRGFWMGKYEVTQAQYRYVMGKRPSHFKGDSLPVESVSWIEATEFCQQLTKLERKAGRLPMNWEYRLPTEAQWEYACRAGTTTHYSFGNDRKQLGDYDWYGHNSDKKTHFVGQKKPNPWGLFDMHGNVQEWCRDWYQDNLPGGADPEVAKESTVRVSRGGFWLSPSSYCRSAFRTVFAGPDRARHRGFRVAAVPTN